MAEKEIKIGFQEEKLEALKFFLKEQNTDVETSLKDFLDKTYEKNVPAQVRKYVERTLPEETQEEQSQEEQMQTSRTQRPARRPRQNHRATEEDDAALTEETVSGQEEAEVSAEENAMGLAM